MLALSVMAATNADSKRFVGARLPIEVIRRLEKRVEIARKRSKGEASVNLSTIIRAILTEHA